MRAILCLLFTLASSFAASQAGETEIVSFVISAQPRNGAGSLSLQISEHNRPIAVERIERLERTGHRILLLVDASGSMQRHADQCRELLKLVVNNVADLSRDTVAIAYFNDHAELLARFTNDRNALLGATTKLQFRGRTRLYDAVLGAIGTTQIEMRKRAGVGDIIVLSDGDDNRSGTDLGKATETVIGSGVRVWTVPMRDMNSSESVLSQLQQFSRKSGGATFPEGPEFHLEATARAITTDLKGSYLVQVRIPKPTAKAQKHNIRVTASEGWDLTYPETVLAVP
ncbi:MAG TPA: VWA domain-containing protein [Terriglobales bacterium]|jgi:VWFA-related protein